jgi:undecaprenyl phosphate-alpha-L-ara4N flippase subunit ArnE
MFSTSLSPAVWAGLILTPMTIAGGQILFKISSGRMGEANMAGFIRLITDPVFIVAVSIYALATFMWVYVLRSVPLSFAYSFNALTFILVPILSALLLGEVLTIRNFIGAALIISGLLVVTS